MITNVSIVSVFVKDVDESKRFYTDVLGFVAKDDITLGDGYRWCTVVHPSQPELMVNLAVPGPPHPPELVDAMKRAQDEGGMHGLGLNVDDCQRTYDELRAKGVEFIQPPSKRPYGTEALCRDNSGNWLVLIEPAIEPYGAEDFESATGADA
jgi:catechol 2,3-dioxygenase-like lactoylglutathione lyase family enzyme